jgi:MFS family permease
LWINVSVLGICFATFFSDVSHEIATAVLPLYLRAVGLGPHILGLIEGVANFAFNVGRFAGGAFGHVVARKKPWTALCYLVTTLGSAGMALTGRPIVILSLRGVAWFARGFRSPLRDYLLAQAVQPRYFGRAYGLERTGDMLGAVIGPLAALFLLYLGWSYPAIILMGFVPGMLAASSLFFLVREKVPGPEQDPADGPTPTLWQAFARFPGRFWVLLIGVSLFALGNYSRSFLIFLVARVVGNGSGGWGIISLPVVLYTLHNTISALTPFPAGALADRTSRLKVLAGGYALGMLTSILLAGFSEQLVPLAAAMIFSGMCLAIEEAMERATLAEILPPELRTLGFGMCGTAVATGQLIASLYVGYWLQEEQPLIGFGLAALFAAAGTFWLLGISLAAGRSPHAASKTIK